MGWLKKHLAAEPEPEVETLPEPDLAGTPYVGGKKPIFREGFYYLCDADGNELGPDISTPLIFDDAHGGFMYARTEDVNHFHRYGLSAVDLEPGTE